MKRLRVCWNYFWFKPVTSFNLGAVRIAVFGLATLFLFLRTLIVEPIRGEWSPVSFFQLLPGPLSSEFLLLLQMTWLLSALAAAVGIAFRWTGPISFFAALLFWGHTLNFGDVFHSQHLYVMLLGILAFSKADHALSWRPPRNVKTVSADYRWPLQWVRAYVVYVMTLCGLEKVFSSGFEWAFSPSLYTQIFIAPSRSSFSAWLLDQPIIVSQVMAVYGLFVIEILSPLALLFPRLGWIYFLIWSTLHPLSTLLFGGHWSFFSHIAGYAAFVSWHDIYRILKSHISARINN